MNRKSVKLQLALKALKRIGEEKDEYAIFLEDDPYEWKDTPMERRYLDLEAVIRAADLLYRYIREQEEKPHITINATVNRVDK